MNYSDEIAIRQQMNLLILKELETLIINNPTQRFGQLLLNNFYTLNKEDSLGFKDIMYKEEPAKTLSRLK